MVDMGEGIDIGQTVFWAVDASCLAMWAVTLPFSEAKTAGAEHKEQHRRRSDFFVGFQTLTLGTRMLSVSPYE